MKIICENCNVTFAELNNYLLHIAKDNPINLEWEQGYESLFGPDSCYKKIVGQGQDESGNKHQGYDENFQDQKVLEDQTG
jgi:hypothetical protein